MAFLGIRAKALHASRPETVLRWLSRPQPRELLAELATGRIPVTHEALHDYPHRNVAEHLRHRLVACGVLPPVDVQLAAFEGWIRRRLAQCGDHPHERLLRRFALWHQLPRLRADAAVRPLRPTAKSYAARQFTGALTFLTWLHEQLIDPGRLSQPDLDTWATSHLVHDRYDAKGFLIWAVNQGHLPGHPDIPGRSSTSAQPSSSNAGSHCCAATSPMIMNPCRSASPPACSCSMHSH